MGFSFALSGFAEVVQTAKRGGARGRAAEAAVRPT
jgi:hypothetical protein